ncbi:MAG: glycosyltransferase family 1 protein [Puniceicoccaceae bacterium]|nr:MAG: glycosyltransferase family 1 protein [Puniceicoccaceae bacterium]
MPATQLPDLLTRPALEPSGQAFPDRRGEPAGRPARRLFIVTHEFFPTRGGIAAFSEEIARAASSLGYATELWAPAHPALSARTWPFTLHPLPLKGSQDFICQVRLAVEIIRQRRRLRHGILYLPEPGPLLAMMYLNHFQAFKPGRLVLTFHGSEILRFASGIGAPFFMSRLIRAADRISTPSDFSLGLLHRHFSDARGKSLITPCALRSTFTTRQARVEMPPPSDKVVILTVGRIHPRKGQLEILEGIQSLPHHLQARVELWLVGETRRTCYLQLLREAAGRTPAEVRFLGPVDDENLGVFYDRADIFALTSINQRQSVEGFGLVYLEASAHGLPVIAHAVGGVPEAVAHGRTGLLVPPHNPEALAAALAQLIENPATRRHLGRNGRAWARRNCWKRSAQALFGNLDPVHEPAPVS